MRESARPEDCLSCRVIGTSVCVGASAPSESNRIESSLEPADARRVAPALPPSSAFFSSLNERSSSSRLLVRAGSSGAIAYELWAGAPRPPAHRYVMGAVGGALFAMGVYRALMT
jgi:hypothetical protein